MTDEIIYFAQEEPDPFPGTTEVQLLLGGLALTSFPDGTVQFLDEIEGESVAFSPRLPRVALEAFCIEHVERYHTYFQLQVVRMMQSDVRLPIEPFWDNTDHQAKD